MSIKVSELGVKETIKYCKDYSNNNPYHSQQIEIFDKDIKGEFLQYLQDLSEISRIDKLDCSISYARKKIDLELKDIIHQAHTSIGCGIKVVMYPMFTLSEYEKWEGGYIEGFARMDSDEKEVEWFHWTYIRMEHLQNILEKFKDDLYIV